MNWCKSTTRLNLIYFLFCLTLKVKSWHIVYPYRVQKSYEIKMDDEIYRQGIKLDITARDDDYLSSKFSKLSSSGHDITPMTINDKNSYQISPAQQFEIYLGYANKGIYVCKVGGLPLFASGYRIDNECNETMLAFTEPCDPTHISINNDYQIHCIRSNEHIGFIDENKTYRVFTSSLRFYDISAQWPVESQPENYWGSEGQYRAWNEHDLDARPLSY